MAEGMAPRPIPLFSGALHAIVEGAGWRAWTPVDAPWPAVHPLNRSRQCEPGMLRYTNWQWRLALRNGEPQLDQEMCLAPSDLISNQIRERGQWSDCDRLVHLWRAVAFAHQPPQPGGNSSRTDRHRARGRRKSHPAMREPPQDGAVLLEAGANIGACTVELLLRTDAQILAFEPSAINLFYLTRSLRLLAKRYPPVARRVVVLPIGLGDKAVSLPLRVQLDNLGNSVLGAPGVAHGMADPPSAVVAANATVMPLDDLLPRGLGSVRLMKLDTQGFECNVLEGGRRVLSSSRGLGAVVTEVTAAMLGRQCCGVQWLLHLLSLPDWQLTCNHRWGDSRTCTALSNWAASSSAAMERLGSLGALTRAAVLGHLPVQPLSPAKAVQASKRNLKCRRRLGLR